jgi:hypothetical protein
VPSIMKTMVRSATWFATLSDRIFPRFATLFVEDPPVDPEPKTCEDVLSIAQSDPECAKSSGQGA